MALIKRARTRSLLRYFVQLCMTLFRTFEDMEVWQESRRLNRKIREICKRPLVRNDAVFIDQITRAARSISHNIAEGCDAMTIPAFIQFLGYAKRSSAEVRSHLYDALDEKYIIQGEFNQLADQAKKICSMIAKLIHHLQAQDRRIPRTFKDTTVGRRHEVTKSREIITAPKPSSIFSS